MLPSRLNILTDTAYPVCRQDRHFYFRLLFFEELFSLSRKASNAITRLPKAHNNVNMPMKIDRISKAVLLSGKRRNEINVAKIKRKPDASDSLRHSPQTSAAILYYIMPHFLRLCNRYHSLSFRKAH